MTLNYKLLNAIADKQGTSFYLFYPEKFSNNLTCFAKMLTSYYVNAKIAYAFKANYMPILGKYLKQHNCWGEVVSGMEYDIARMFLVGNKIIFNGPCKTKQEISRALNEGAILNIDSFYELSLLEEIAAAHTCKKNNKNKIISVGIRVSFDIGIGDSRFGFNYENGDFLKAVNKLRSIDKVRLISLHSHFTTKERSLKLFARRVQGMLDIYESIPMQEQIEYLNIGGGFFGYLSDAAKRNFKIIPPTFAEYASLIGGLFHDYFGDNGPVLFVEPGVSMIANTMDFIVQVLDIRNVKGKNILTVDGSVNNLFPTGSKYKPDYTVFSSTQTRKQISCDIAGYTCMEHDILMANIIIAAAPGDYIVFHNRGAYSNVYKPPFIKSAPPIIGIDGTIFSRRQTFEDVIATYNTSESL